MSFFSTDEELIKQEAQVFCKYLIGVEATEQTIQLYISANSKLGIEVTPKERRQINYLLDNPRVIPWIDAALALMQPEGGIRKKLYIMFCITESIPTYSRFFLPQEHAKKFVFSAVFRILISLFRMPVGLILMLWI